MFVFPAPISHLSFGLRHTVLGPRRSWPFHMEADESANQSRGPAVVPVFYAAAELWDLGVFLNLSESQSPRG